MFGGGTAPAKTPAAAPAKQGGNAGAQPGGGQGGMFDGMTVKAGAAGKQQAAPPAKQHPANLQLPAKRGGTTGNGLPPPVGYGASAGPPGNIARAPAKNPAPPPQQAPPAASAAGGMDLGGGGGGMDLFSGMSLMPADHSGTSVDNANNGGSLLSMLNDGTPSDANGDATAPAADGSAFNFLSAEAGEPTDGVKASGSAFDFFGGEGITVSNGGITLEDTLSKGDTGSGGLDFGGMTIAAEDHNSGASPASSVSSPSPVPSSRVNGINTSTPPQHVVTGISIASPLPASARPPPTPVAAVAPSTPVAAPQPSVDLKEEATLTATLSKLRTQIEAALIVHFNDAKRFNDTQAELRSRELKLASTVRRATADLKTSEQAQTDAVHSEDFEKADQMNSVLDRLKAEVGSATRDLVAVRANLEATMNRRAATTAKVKQILEGAVGKFGELRSTQEREMNTFVHSETSRIEKQEDQLNSDFDRVDRTIVHVDLDLSEVKKEEEGVETAITTETKDVAAEKATLVELETKLDIELEELKQKLRLKQEEIASVRKQVQVADAKINETRDRHHRRLKRINEKRDRIVEDKNQAEADLAGLKAKRAKLQEESRFVASKQVEYKTMISGIGDEVDTLVACVSRLASEDKRREDWLRTVEEERGESVRVGEQLRMAQIAIEKLNAELLELETSVSSNHNNIVSIDLRIPGLEAEKRVAVTGRNFKSAATLSKEITTLATSKAESQKKLEELKVSAAACKDQLRERNDDKAAILRKQANLEDSADETRLRSLLYTARALRKLIDQVTSSRTLAPRQQQSELDALNAEMKACQQEQQDLCAKHNWLDNHIELPAERDAPPPVKIGGTGGAAADGLDFGGLTLSPHGSAATPTSAGSLAIGGSPNGILSPNGTAASSSSSSGGSLFDGLSSPTVASSAATSAGTPIAAAAAVTSPVAPPKPVRWAADVAAAKQDEKKGYEAKIASLEAELDAAINTDRFDDAERLEEEKKGIQSSLDHLIAAIRDNDALPEA